MKWFSRKAEEVKPSAEVVVASPADDFDRQFEKSKERAGEARRRGTGAYRVQAQVDRAGTPKPSRKKKGR